MSKTILVTGGAGFIGSNFVRHIYRTYPDYKIIVLDALTYAGDVGNLPVSPNETTDDRLIFWYGNVRNGELVDTLMSQSNAVVHFAAETHVTRSIYDNFSFFETDVLGTAYVANSVLKYIDRIERFIHISTSEVYGTALDEKMSESHPLNPCSPYAAAKTGADRLVYSYNVTYPKFPSVIIRPFNNYGPWQHLEKVVPRFITSCILGEPLNVHGDGSALRDWMFVEDTVEAIDTALHAPGEKVNGQIFNVGSGRHIDIKTIAETICDRMNYDRSNIRTIGDRPGQVFRHTADASRIFEILGCKPKMSFEQGLDRTIEWYRANKSWWEKQKFMRTVPIISQSGRREFH